MKMPREFSSQHRFPRFRKVMVDPSLVLCVQDSKKIAQDLNLFLDNKAEFYSTRCLDIIITTAIGKKGLIPNRKLVSCMHTGPVVSHLECLKKIFGKHNPNSFIWATSENVNFFEQTFGIPVVSATAEGRFFFCPPSRHQREYAYDTQFEAKNRHRGTERREMSRQMQNNRFQGKGKKHGSR